jgi:hypothetical protein
VVGVSAVGAGERPSARRRAVVGRHRERCIVTRPPRRKKKKTSFFYSISGEGPGMPHVYT